VRQSAAAAPKPPPERGLLLVDEEGAVYRVEALLAARPKGKGRQLLVRWEDYGAEFDSWEDEANILDQKMIAAFDRSMRHASQDVASPARRPQSGTTSGAVTPGASSPGLLAPSSKKRVRLGDEYQVSSLPEAVPLVQLPDWLAGKCCCAKCDRAMLSSSDETPPLRALPSHAPPFDGLSPACHCGVAAAWNRQLFWCEAGECDFEYRPPVPVRPTRISTQQIESEMCATTVAALGAAAHGPSNAWSFVAPSMHGLGLFARAPLKAGQAISEYAGPRLPKGRVKNLSSEFVLEMPGTNFVIDGSSENSPFDCPRTPAIFANHSTLPNARLEVWPVLQPAACQARQHMVLVANEAIAPGQEIRINYEDGATVPGLYWGTRGGAPPEEDWRRQRLHPPPRLAEAPVVDRLADLRTAAALGQAPPPIEPLDPLPEQVAWEGEAGGDQRLRAVVPLFGAAKGGARGGWAHVATHLPGRSGIECRERWALLSRRSARACVE